MKNSRNRLTGITPMDVQVLFSAGHLREFLSVTSEFPGKRIWLSWLGSISWINQLWPRAETQDMTNTLSFWVLLERGNSG